MKKLIAIFLCSYFISCTAIIFSEKQACKLCNSYISLQSSNMIFYTKDEFIKILNHAISCGQTYNAPSPAPGLNPFLAPLNVSNGWVSLQQSNPCNFNNIVGFYVRAFSGPDSPLSTFNPPVSYNPPNSVLNVYAVKSDVGNLFPVSPSFNECTCNNFAVLCNSAQQISFDEDDLTFNIQNSSTNYTFHPYEMQFAPTIPAMVEMHNGTYRKGKFEDVFGDSFIGFHDLAQILSHEDLTHIGISGAKISTGNHQISESDGVLSPFGNQDHFTLKFTGFRHVTEEEFSIGVEGTHVQLNIKYKRDRNSSLPYIDYSIPAETWAVPCPPRWKEQ